MRRDTTGSPDKGHTTSVNSTAWVEEQEWQSFLRIWWDEYRVFPVPSRTLLRLARQFGMLSTVLGTSSESSQTIRLGKFLKANLHRGFGGFIITASRDSHRKRNCWRLSSVTGCYRKQGHSRVIHPWKDLEQIETGNAPKAVTPVQAVMWLFHQKHICCSGVHSRLNMIAGLLLWNLARRAALPVSPPRLYLYGDDEAHLQATTANMASMLGLPVRHGKQRSGRGRQRNDVEILVVTPPSEPSLAVVEDRHCFVLMVGTEDPHRWYRHQAVARRVLPIRLKPGLAPAPPPFAVPDVLDVLCDTWTTAGRPGLNGGNYSWPVETMYWRSITEGILEAAHFPFQPRSIVTIEDI